MINTKSFLYEMHTMKCHYGIQSPPTKSLKKKKDSEEQSSSNGEANFGPHNCLFCAMESRSDENLREFFRQWPQNSDSKNLLVLPLSNLIQYVGGSDKQGNALFYLHVGCLHTMVQFQKRYDMDFVSFYSTRIINIMTRKMCGESLIESFGKGFGNDRLIKNLVEVINDQHTLEKREALMCLGNICKYVSENSPKSKNLDRQETIAKITGEELIDCNVLDAMINSFKFLNVYQFKAELNDSQIISKLSSQKPQLGTSFVNIENHLVDLRKVRKGEYQKDLLTRQTIPVNDKIIKISLVDCQRCLAKAVYWFSKIDFKFSTDAFLLARCSKELFSEMAKLLHETNDYAIQCYLLAAFHNFHRLDYFTNRDVLSEKLTETLKDTIYFDSNRLDNLDKNVGWKTPVGTLPESGWTPQTKWINLDGILEAEYYDTYLNLQQSSLRSLLTEEDLLTLPETSSTPTPNEPKIALSSLKPIKSCAMCGSTKDLKVCAKCKKVHYCSRDCQVKAWKDHKLLCKP